MNDTLPTVTIKTKVGPVRINASDFDASKHELVDGSALPLNTAPVVPATEPPTVPPATPPTTTEPTTPAAQKYVQQIGKRWFVTDDKGAKLDRQSATGYATQEEAAAQAGKM